MRIRSGTKGFILCFIIALMLTFFGGAAFGATNPYGTTTTEGLWAQDGTTDNNDGTISTTSASTNYWGMRATDGSTINNRYKLSFFGPRRGTIITTSDFAHGMWAEQNSTANNNYRITTSGNYAWGMYATGGSTINNNFDLLGSPYIRTSGSGSHGMVAEGSGSTAWNYTDIQTTGDYSYGMLATDGAQAYNIGIKLWIFDVAGSIETEGGCSHGMLAWGRGSIAANVGSIKTSGPRALGMSASDLGLALNAGHIETTKEWAEGMRAENIALALNLGEIKTKEKEAHGMVASEFGLAVNMKGLPDLGGLDGIPLAGPLLDILDRLNYFPGKIETEGDDAHGMVATNWSAAINLGEIATHGNGSYGMLAEEFGLALNMGDIANEKYGSHGMVAKNWAAAFNAGSITTNADHWAEGSYGMLAEDHSIAVNGGSLLSLGSGLFDLIPGDFFKGIFGDEGGVGQIADGLVGFLGSLFGDRSSKIVTEGRFSSGMVARNWSAAINTGSILVGAPGFPDTDTDEDEGDDDNHEPDSFRLFAINSDDRPENDSYEEREPSPEGGSYGMLAEYYSLVANLSANSIETWLDGAHGMVADTFGLALNTGAITTHGNSANGIWAKNQSLALNFGDIVTEGVQSYGMRIQDESFGLNTGSITTGEQDSVGLLVEQTSTGLNSGSIETDGLGAHGMEAFDRSIIANLGGGRIETHGLMADGMSAHNSFAVNNGDIITNFSLSYGMVGSHSLIANLGDGKIETHGNGSHGMDAKSISLALNAGTIITHGEDSIGMEANHFSLGINTGSIITHGPGSIGMLAMDHSLVANLSANSIETWLDGAHGMVADTFGLALNTGAITTHGNSANGIWAKNQSLALNYGDIVTEGDQSYGMRIQDESFGLNTGSIITHGKTSVGMLVEDDSLAWNTGTIETKEERGHGMVVDKSLALNTGEIVTSGAESRGMIGTHKSSIVNTGKVTTKGDGADAVTLSDSTFWNAGVLDSAKGNAVTAEGGCNVFLLDGTKLEGSHTLEDEGGDSNLVVWMDDDLSAQVVNFGKFLKTGGGTFLVEGGSSVVGNTLTAQGTLAVEAGTQFKTDTYDQLSGSNLYLYANPDSAVTTNLGAIPLWVEDVQHIKGSVYIDLSTATLPGHYRYIRAENKDWDFDTHFVNSSYFVPYDPQWITGGSYVYTSFLGYSFSHAALGMVAAIDDWSLLRYVMANHLNDVADCMKQLEVGEKKIHAQVLAGQTKHDPSSATSAGFDSTQKGISLGFDKKQNDSTLWGLYIGYTEKDIDFTGLPMVYADWESQDTWHFGAYISKRWDKWILSDTLTYRRASHDTFRKQVGGDARASFDSWAVTNDLRLGYVAKEIGEGSHWQVIPEVGLNVGYINRGGYTEDNGFTYGDFSHTVVESVVGIRFKGEYHRGDGSTFIPQLRLGWAHILSGEDITIEQSWGGTTYSFTESLDRDYLVADLGLSLCKYGNMDLSLNYGGRFGSNSTTHGGWLRLEWKF